MLDLTVLKIVPADKDTVFRYMTRPELVEQWSAPDNMSLSIPKFEARPGGKYRYEHSNQEGVYICDGHFKEIDASAGRLVMVDTVRAPDGKLMFENLECTITLRSLSRGTEISVFQAGFPDKESRKGCEEGWHQCLNKLNDLLYDNQGNRPLDEMHP